MCMFIKVRFCSDFAYILGSLPPNLKTYAREMLLKLPVETIEQIATHLQVAELLGLQLTCKRARSIVAPKLWENVSLNVGDIDPKGPMVTGKFTNTNPFDQPRLIICDTDHLKEFSKLMFNNQHVFGWIRRLSVNIQSFIQTPTTVHHKFEGLTNFVYWFLLQVKEKSHLVYLDVRTALGKTWANSIVSFILDIPTLEIALTMSFYRPLHGQCERIVRPKVTKITADVRHFNGDFFADLKAVCGDTLGENVKQLLVYGIGEHRELVPVNVNDLQRFLSTSQRLDRLRLSNFHVPSTTNWIPQSITYLGISQELDSLPDHLNSTLSAPELRELDVRSHDGHIFRRLNLPKLETLTLRKRGPYTPVADYIMGEEELVENIAFILDGLKRLNFEDISIPCLRGILSQTNNVEHLYCNYATFTTMSKPVIHSMILDIAECLPQVETVRIDFSIDLGQEEYPLFKVVQEFITHCPNLHAFDIQSMKFPTKRFPYISLDKDGSTGHVNLDLFKELYMK